MRCEHAFDDGAYVLGALGPAERDAFEKHLAGCADCRDAVAGIAVLPGLLGRLSAADAAASTAASAEFVTEQRIPKLVEAVTAARRRERRRLAAAALVTACVTLFAGLAVGSARHVDPVAHPSTGSETATSPTPSPTVSLAVYHMVPLEPGTEVTAEMSFEELSSGTQVTMRCAYPEKEGHTRAYVFRLVAIGLDGSTEQVSSWTAAPGEQVTVVGTVRLNLNDMVRLELRTKAGTAILAYDVP